MVVLEGKAEEGSTATNQVRPFPWAKEWDNWNELLLVTTFGGCSTEVHVMTNETEKIMIGLVDGKAVNGSGQIQCTRTQLRIRLSIQPGSLNWLLWM